MSAPSAEQPTRRGGRARARSWALLLACGTALLVGCSTPAERPPVRTVPPAEARAMIERLMPASVADRPGWARDIYAALATLDIAPTAANACAVLAVIEQESTYRVDPPVPGLPTIAWSEIDKQADRLGVPRLVVRTALRLSSPTGKSYAERIDAVKTEKQLSDVFDDFIEMVPLGKTFFASRNPVRTGGPMQVSIAFAEQQAARKTYPYPRQGSWRDEVFTRRGGLYFGIAHLLDYAAPYEYPLYRFADFNAGRYASRNAAFQNAVSTASGIPLALDGDLLPPNAANDAPRGATELAAASLAGKLDMSVAAVRDDLERGPQADFERTRLYQRTMALAGRLNGTPMPTAVVPRITLHSPKITRELTTDWFARRVNDRYKRCVAQDGS